MAHGPEYRISRPHAENPAMPILYVYVAGSISKTAADPVDWGKWRLCVKSYAIGCDKIREHTPVSGGLPNAGGHCAVVTWALKFTV